MKLSFCENKSQICIKYLSGNVFGAVAHVHDIKDDSGHEGEHAGEMGHTGLHELLPILHGAPTRPHQVHVG